LDNKGHVTGIKACPETVQRYLNEVKVATYPQILPNIDEYEIEDKSVLIFDDRIIFSNPGKIYGNLTIEDLKRDDYVSSIRNKLLAEAYYLTGDIEKYGTGYVRIRRILKDSPEVLFDLSMIGVFFRVELRAVSVDSENLPENLPENLTEKLTETQQDIRI